MNLNEEEISDEELAMKEEEFSEFAESLSPEPASDARIESILRRARMEAVVKDSAEFVAVGVGKGLLGIVDTMVCLGKSDDRPKRTY